MPGMRRVLLSLAAALVLALAGAGGAQAAVQELGVAPDPPKVSCPEDCNAVGRVTGYQVLQKGQKRDPFKVTRAGKVVAFSIRLGKPTPEQISSFASIFGTSAARVRLSILRPMPKRQFKLLAQSEIFRVNRYFGSAPTFALAAPLRVERGAIVAITVPTWVPAFSLGLGNDDAWRSSRAKGSCDALTKDAAMQRLRGVRTFDCLYRTARLRYTVSFVPAPEPTS